MKKIWQVVRLFCSAAVYWFKHRPTASVKHDGVRFVVDVKSNAAKKCRHQKPASKCNDEECIIRYVTGS